MMIVNQYDPRSARMLAMATVANATGPRGRTANPHARIIDVGGGWNNRSWRDALRRLADRSTVAALAIRTRPPQRQLADNEWEQITRRLAQQAGLGRRPWVAVRTSPTTVAVLTDSTSGKLDVDGARRFARRVSVDYGLRIGRPLPESPTMAPPVVPRLSFLSSPAPTAFRPADESEAVAPPTRPAPPSPAPAASVSLDPTLPRFPVEPVDAAVDRDIIRAASIQWERMATSRDRRGRITMAAELAWKSTYVGAYHHGYNALRDAATTQFAALRDKLETLPLRQGPTINAADELLEIARRATPSAMDAPPISHNALEIATRAALDRPEGQTAPEAIVRAVCRNAAAVGGRTGALAACADIKATWRSGHEDHSFNAMIANDEVLTRLDTVLADVERQLSAGLAAHDGSVENGPETARASFAAPPGTNGPPKVPSQAAVVDLHKARLSR